MNKRIMTKKVLALLTALIVTFSGNSLAAGAAAPTAANGACQSTAEFLNSLTTSQKQQISSKYKNGYIKPKVTIPKIQTDRKIFGSSNIPSTYDLRTQNRVTSVKDQGDTSGSCWAFASIGSMESCLMPTENRDFSENNLKNNSGFDYDPNEGGNDLMATAYFARWGGPYNETDDPYVESSTSSTSTGPVQKHVQDVIYLPARANSTDNDAIKSAVMQYGAVSASMYMGGNDEDAIDYDRTDNYYSSSQNDVDHEVDIVGWDDSYQASNFCDYDSGNAVPSGNGAFIAKNSWGTNWGDGGYFYISYYDANLAYDMESVFYDAESTNNYSDMYQYDPLGWVGHFNVNWMANVFTATDSNPLAAVSFYAINPSTSYSVYVVSNYSGASNLSNIGTPVKSGSLTYSGYYTVNLDNAVPLTAGKKFAVIVKFSSPDGSGVPIEYADSGYSSKAAASPGESYISSDGSDWQDTTSSDSTCNVCLKAFSEKQATVTSIALKSAPTKTSYLEGQSLDLSGACITVNYSDGTSADIPITPDMVSGYNNETVGTQNVTVTYLGKTTSFAVNVGNFDIENGVLVKYSGSDSSVTIPDGVTSIGDSAFENCNSLISVVIPSGVTSIGNGAFQDCHYLSQISIPDTVTSIGASAFRTCADLTKIVIPYGVAAIGDSTFQDCYDLADVKIPNSVTSIGNYAFFDCMSLRSIVIPSSVTSSGQNIFEDCNDFYYICGSGSYADKCFYYFSDNYKTVSSISMNTNPTRTTYTREDNIDLTGAKINLTYGKTLGGETSDILDVTPDMVSGYNNETVGTQNVTVTYLGKTASFAVTVNDKPVSSIAMKSNPSTLTYVAGQSLNLNGAAITVDYTDGTSRDIDVLNTMVSGFDSNTVGSQTITVKYGEKTATFTINVLPSVSVTYEGHIQNIGWQQGWVSDGAECGTDGKSLRVEAINVKLNNASNLGIEYQVHVQNKSWMDWTPGGTVAGTEGQCLRIEAVRIRLTGANAQYYSVAYMAHVQNVGWQNWVKDGEDAGTTGKCLRIEALKIVIVPKLASVSYASHVQNIGWQDAVSNGALSGTTGRALRVEALEMNLQNAPAGLSIQYCAHVQNIGWQSFVSDGDAAGTTGKSLRVEAIKINLYTDPSKIVGTDKYKYKVIYQVHVQNKGWMDWQSDGNIAGTMGQCLRIEALRVMIVPDI